MIYWYKVTCWISKNFNINSVIISKAGRTFHCVLFQCVNQYPDFKTLNSLVYFRCLIYLMQEWKELCYLSYLCKIMYAMHGTHSCFHSKFHMVCLVYCYSYRCQAITYILCIYVHKTKDVHIIRIFFKFSTIYRILNLVIFCVLGD